VDYGRGDWAKAVALIRKDPDKSEKALVRFIFYFFLHK
jgi:hypothetical protein